MKRALVILFLVTTVILSAVAQDIITLRNGQELKARIVRLNPKNVAFVPEGATDTALLVRDEVIKLFYSSGTVIYLSQITRPPVSNEPINDSMYNLGEKDASKYYKGYRGAATSTLITSFFVPFGLIPAIACSATPPAMEKLGYRDQKLIENQSYYRGYSDKATKIKKRKVWRSFALGTGITAGYYLIMIALVSSMYMM